VIAHADPQSVEKQIPHRHQDRSSMEGIDLAIDLCGQAADGSG
jgi:hypothetical protein